MKPDRGSRPSWSVVLADDNDDHALLIQMALERVATVPLDIRRARNGDEALALVAASPPNLLLLDLNMPGRSGHEVLERIKGDERLRRIPVAVLTSSDRDEDVAESYGLGGNHFITKPGDPSELDRRLASLLRNLRELEQVSRGTSGILRTGASAERAGSYRLQRSLPIIGFALLFAALIIWAWRSGVLQS